MKKVFSLLLIGALPVFFSGCRDNQEQLTPELAFDSSVIEAPADGGTVDAAYTLTNPSPTAEFLADYDEDWITGCDFSEEGVMKVSVSRNDGEKSRECFITVTYANVQARLMVRQNGAGPRAAVELELTNITTSSVDVKFMPEDSEATYFGMVITKRDYDAYCEGSDDKLYELVMSNYNMYAEQLGVTLEEFLTNQILMTGEQSYTIGDLTYKTEYIMFAAYMETTGELASEINKEPFTTQDVEKVNAKFDVKPYVTDDFVLVTEVDPYDYDQYYFVDAVDEQTLESGNVSYEVYFEKSLNATLMFTQTIMGMTVEETLALIASKGRDTITWGSDFLMYDRSYIVAAFAINNDGIINSDMSTATLKTDPCEPSDNQLSFEIGEISCDRVSYRVNATNDDPYVTAVVMAELYEGLSDEEIIAKLQNGGYIGSAQSGSRNKQATSLNENTDYIIFGLGYDRGVITTGLFKSEVFTTGGYKSPEELDVEIGIKELTPWSVVVQIQADPVECLYWYMVVDPDYTGDQAKAYLYSLAEAYTGQGVTAIDYYRGIGYRGTSSTYFQVHQYDEFKVILVGIDDQDGSLGPVFESEVYEVPDLSYSTENIGIGLSYDKYFDGSLIAQQYSQYFDFAGRAVIPVEVQLEGDPAEWCVAVTSNTSSDVSDKELMYQLNDLLGTVLWNKTSFDLAINWDREMLVFAVAYDDEGNISKIYREQVSFSRSGVSPIEEYNPIGDVITYSKPAPGNEPKMAVPLTGLASDQPYVETAVKAAKPESPAAESLIERAQRLMEERVMALIDSKKSESRTMTPEKPRLHMVQKHQDEIMK